ncbi:MAG: sensor histidine kinase [Spirochaetes bacterium]|nr:sensor histidine kinase [Spirochaetota bacterium]
MRQVKGFIQIYSRQARDRVIEAGKKFLAVEGLEILSSELFACVDELIKNAVKANYKFLLLRERIIEKFRQLWPDKTEREIEEDISDLIKIPGGFNRLAEEILKTEDISASVREILNEESILLSIKNSAYKEKRKLAPEERETLLGLSHFNGIREKIERTGVRIILRIQADKDYIYIEVTNTAPILEKDLNRIHEKRERHRRYKEEGREQEYFADSIDTSESGFGLGYAKIDAILNDWGIGGERAITIISAINTTVMLTLPIDGLKEQFK